MKTLIEIIAQTLEITAEGVVFLLFMASIFGPIIMFTPR